MSTARTELKGSRWRLVVEHDRISTDESGGTIAGRSEATLIGRPNGRGVMKFNLSHDEFNQLLTAVNAGAELDEAADRMSITRLT